MIGARDMAFPRLNALSYWLLLAGGIVFYASVFWNPPEAGWVSVVPLANSTFSPSGGEDAWIFLIHLTGISSLLGAINFYATIANMRARGMSWGRLPLFVWTILTYSVLLIFALPVIAAAVTMLLTERHLGTHFFDPAAGRLAAALAAPLLVLRAPRGLHHGAARVRPHLRDPARVRAQADLRLQGDRRLDGRDRLPRLPHVGAPHVHGADPEAMLVFVMLSSFLIAVPTGVKVLNWVATLWRGTIEFKTPLLFCAGGVSIFLIGGISGIFLATFPIDWQVNETYFVVAHLHFVLWGGAVMPIFAGDLLLVPEDDRPHA